jgi:hypothetical protein
MLCQRLGVVSFVALPLFLRVVIGQYTAEFQYPSGNDSYNILDTVIVQWNSSASNSASSDAIFPNPVLFTWFLDPATDQVEQGESNVIPIDEKLQPYRPPTDFSSLPSRGSTDWQT